MVAVSLDRKSTRLNSSHGSISYAVFCLKKKTVRDFRTTTRERDNNGAFTANAGFSVGAPTRMTVPASTEGRIASCFFFFNDTATTEIYTLSLHDALPICSRAIGAAKGSRSDIDEPAGC